MEPGTLYVVSTPIGNLSDLSERAREVLGSVVCVYAEDTRRTGRLLAHIGVRSALRSLHAHNEAARTDEVLAHLLAGESCALVSDAGTPAVSDPGARVVAAASGAGAPVVPIPGPSAVMAALAASGFSADNFAFLGFPPRTGGARERWMERASALRMPIVAFESPRRMGALLYELVGRGMEDRRCVVCRELTKLYEEIRRGTVSDLADYYAETEPRGEMTLVVEGGEATEDEAGEGAAIEEARLAAHDMHVEGLTSRQITRRLKEEFGLARNAAYGLALAAADEAAADEAAGDGPAAANRARTDRGVDGRAAAPDPPESNR